MSGINKAIIVGNLGKDPELKFLQSGVAVCSFSIATSEEWKDKNTGEKKAKTQWHNITAWGNLGEVCGQYLGKGRQVYIEGQIEYETVEKDGITRYYTKIKASKVEFLGSKNDSQQQGKPQVPAVPAAQAGNYNQQSYPQAQQFAAPVTAPPAGMQQPGNIDDGAIPF